MKTFKTRWWLKPICEKITNHKHKELIMWTDDFRRRGFKYPNRSDFHYKCKICGYVFFNHKVNEKDLEKIKKYYEEEEKKNETNKNKKRY